MPLPMLNRTNLMMSWCWVDSASFESIDEGHRYIVVTDAGKWGLDHMFLYMGKTLKMMLGEQAVDKTQSRQRVIAYAQIQLTDVIRAWTGIEERDDGDE